MTSGTPLWRGMGHSRPTATTDPKTTASRLQSRDKELSRLPKAPQAELGFALPSKQFQSGRSPPRYVRRGGGVKGGKESVAQARCGAAAFIGCRSSCAFLQSRAFHPGGRGVGYPVCSERRERKRLQESCGKVAEVYETPVEVPEAMRPHSSGIEPSIGVRKSLVLLGEAMPDASFPHCPL